MSSTNYSVYLNSLNTQITSYYLIITSVIGLPTNILSVIVFARIMRNKTNMGFLCMIQSGVDFLLLLMVLLVFRSSPLIFRTRFANTSDSTCKLLSFLSRFMIHSSCCITVLITFDRYMAVMYQNKFKFMKSKRNILAIIFGMLVVIALADIPNLFNYLSDSPRPTCTASIVIDIASDITAILFRGYIPLLLMSIMNYFIIRKIRQSGQASSRQTSVTRKENHFTKAVIAYDVFFLICSSPVSVFFIIYDIYLYTGALDDNPDLGASFSLANGMASNISYCKQVFTFFMSLAFNKLFRQEMVKFVRKPTVLPTNTMTIQDKSIN